MAATSPGSPAPLTFAVIGTGGIAHNHIRDFLATPGVTAVGFADPSATNLAAAARAFPGVATFTDAEAMLLQTRPDIVTICTPNKFHKENTLLALRLGAACGLRKTARDGRRRSRGHGGRPRRRRQTGRGQFLLPQQPRVPFRAHPRRCRRTRQAHAHQRRLSPEPPRRQSHTLRLAQRRHPRRLRRARRSRRPHDRHRPLHLGPRLPPRRRPRPDADPAKSRRRRRAPPGHDRYQRRLARRTHRRSRRHLRDHPGRPRLRQLLPPRALRRPRHPRRPFRTQRGTLAPRRPHAGDLRDVEDGPAPTKSPDRFHAHSGPTTPAAIVHALRGENVSFPTFADGVAAQRVLAAIHTSMQTEAWVIL